MTGAPLSLVIWDVDGTLVDSQAFILAAMAEAFDRRGHAMPEKERALGIVGLSLPEAMAELLPGHAPDEHHATADAYKAAFLALRQRSGGEAQAPLYEGAAEALARLDAAGHLMSIATGKARRGLEHFLHGHGLKRYFLGTQTADDAPSKPHPQMVLNCLAATGVEAGRAVMVGDTEFDMAMARAAGCRAIGVAWGYHPVERLTRGGAEAIVEDFAELDDLVAGMMGVA